MIQIKAVLYISEAVSDIVDKWESPDRKTGGVTVPLSTSGPPLASKDALTGILALESKPNPSKELRASPVDLNNPYRIFFLKADPGKWSHSSSANC